MKPGKFYGIGIGPGDPDLITLKGVAVLRQCRHVFIPKARIASESVALTIARSHLADGSQVHELIFPMTENDGDLAKCWEESAATVSEILKKGTDACFLTLGDPMVYSTFIYLMRALKRCLPELETTVVPGITSFSAAAALTEFSLGEKKEPITVIPTSDDLLAVRSALERGGTVVLMKIGARLQEILCLLEEMTLIEDAVFVSHAGQASQRVETNLRKMKLDGANSGYLSVILVHASGKGAK